MLMSFRTPFLKRSLACSIALVVLVMTGVPTLGSWVYRVNRGDSIFLIARKVAVPQENIQKANNLQTERIQTGDKLVIPESKEAASLPKSQTWTYRVQNGDSLFGIARKVGVPLSRLVQINDLKRTTIVPGQSISIPYVARTARPAASSVSRGTVTGNSVDLNTLARLIYAESRGEKFVGQVAVGAVIVNRVKSGRFPRTIRGVVYSPGQFCTVRDGQINMTPNKTAYDAARAALNGWDPTGGALYFYNPAKTTSSWIWSRSVTTRIGSHVFAR